MQTHCRGPSICSLLLTTGRLPVVKNVTPPQPSIGSRTGRRGKGRPPLLDSVARSTLLDALREGNRLQVAARIAGVGVPTVEEWMRRGRGLDRRPATPFYVQFVKDVEMAQAEAEQTAVQSINRSIRQGDARTAIWFLERQAAWRTPPVAPPTEPTDALVPAPDGPRNNIIILSPDVVRRLASEHLSAARGDADGSDERRLARARLVEDIQPV